MAIDFNPLNSSIFTGAGTPWGATVNKPADWSKFNQDPNAYQGFDSSELSKALRRRIAQRGGEAQAQAQAQLSKSGIKGADTTRAISDLTAQQAASQDEMEANLAMQDYQSKLANRDFAARMFAQDAASQDARAMSEDMGRSAFWNSMMNLGGQAGGIALGSWLGNKGNKAPGGDVSGATYSGYGLNLGNPWKNLNVRG